MGSSRRWSSAGNRDTECVPPVVLGESEFTVAARRIFDLWRWNHLATFCWTSDARALIFETPKDQKVAWCRGPWGMAFSRDEWNGCGSAPVHYYTGSFRCSRVAIWSVPGVQPKRTRRLFDVHPRWYQVLHDHWLVDRKQKAEPCGWRPRGSETATAFVGPACSVWSDGSTRQRAFTTHFGCGRFGSVPSSSGRPRPDRTGSDGGMVLPY